MKKCRFHNPNFISLYYDGLLKEDEKKAFSEHLLTCKQCMYSLLNLEKDLFLMRSLKYKKLPKRAVFMLFSEGVKLIKNIAGPVKFKPLVPVPVRGKEESNVYRIEKSNISVDIGSDRENLFNLEISGVMDKSISLYCNGRLIEARAHVKEERVVIYSLERGLYRLVVEEEDFGEFIVE